jgi:hypothetical protein
MARLKTLLYLVAFGWLGLSAIVWLVHVPLLHTVGFTLPLLPLLRIFYAFSFEASGGVLSLAVAALVLGFVVRRSLAFRAQRSLAPPESFSGFAYGLVWLGLVLMSVNLIARALAPSLGMRFPTLYMLGFQFGPAWYTPWLVLAFFMSELPTLRAAHASPPAPRRWPVCGPLALALPFLGLVPIFLVDRLAVSGWGGFLVGLLSVYACLGLGAIFTVASVLRRERLVPVQVLAAFVNFSGLGYFMSIS